jgi:signal transduction histidine kinase
MARLMDQVGYTAVEKASQASVQVERVAEGLRISVRDDGRGMVPADAWGAGRETGFGLLSLREQVEAIGGKFGLDSAPGAGTTVWAVLPVIGLDHADAHSDR